MNLKRRSQRVKKNGIRLLSNVCDIQILTETICFLKIDRLPTFNLLNKLKFSTKTRPNSQNGTYFHIGLLGPRYERTYAVKSTTTYIFIRHNIPGRGKNPKLFNISPIYTMIRIAPRALRRVARRKPLTICDFWKFSRSRPGRARPENKYLGFFLCVFSFRKK